jgi:hypothetical protein
VDLRQFRRWAGRMVRETQAREVSRRPQRAGESPRALAGDEKLLNRRSAAGRSGGTKGRR